MIRILYSPLVAVAVAASLLSMSSPLAAEDEQPLIELLKSDAPKADKAITCKKLAIWGSPKAVPALAELLTDPELISWARIALEVIPGPEADEALRDAMGKVEGRSLVGVINSIGVRQDADAVEALVAHLQDEDAAVASAAAVALGRIGNDASTAALQEALKTAPDAVRSAVAEGCILCAEKLLADGNADAAAELYDAVRAGELPKQRIVEATRGAILARGADGIPLLVEQLKSSDRAMVRVGLMTARELSGPGVSAKLITALADVAPDLQALLILAMADRGDAEATPAMLKAAENGPEVVRLSALEVLKSIGDASCVPVLLRIATEGEEDVADAAKETLKVLPGDGVDEELVKRLGDTEGKERVALIELVGARRIDAVAPLLKAVDDADAEVRAAALLALGEVAKLENVPVLITRVVNPENAEDAAIALKALRAACVRMPEREACAQQLTEALADAPAGAKDAILETLKEMGGKRALQTVGEAAKSQDAQLQDTATRLLGNWMSVDAGPVLLELAKSPESPYQIRALRGYIRLVRQFVVSDQQRAEMCRKAWEAAQRDAERKLVLQVLERYPSVGTLRVAIDATKVPSLKDEANSIAISIAQKISGQADVQDLLKQVQGEPVKVEIVKATYGARNRQKDVTSILQKHVTDFPLIVLPEGNYNEAFGGDPIRNVSKTLKVEYRINGKAGEAEFAENAAILLPVPK